MEYLFGGICLLTAVAVIGHGLWTLVAMLLRGAARPVGPISRSCPRCGLPLVGAVCDVCHWPAQTTRPPDGKLALRTLAAQIKHLGAIGAFDATTRDHLLASVEQERLRRADVEASRAAAAAPVASELPVEVPPMEAKAPVDVEAPIEAEVIEEPIPVRPAVVPVAGRAAAFVAKRATAAPTASSAPPRRGWSDWLAAFMEERNMRWGELVGGLLIVCCSIALVVSFWSEIEQRPWLKFSLFGGVTAALFGAGFYCEHRWRLRTTSQGLLSIGCLLVPLNFLAIAALSSAPGTDGWLTVAGEMASSAVFAVLVYFAGRVLIRRDAALLAAGLIVPALAQLLVRRFVQPGVDDRTLLAMVALPAGCYLAVNLWHVRQVARLPIVSEVTTNALFKFLGLTSFAAALPLALLLYKSGEPIETLRRVPALAALVGFVPLSAGLFLWQRLAGRSLAGLRTAGGSIALFGATVSISALFLGWPEPVNLLPVALIEFAIFSFVAWRYGIPAAHLLAAPCLALAYLLVAHLAQETIALDGNGALTILAVLVSGESGVLLAPLVVAYFGASLVCFRREWLSGRALAIATGGLMAVSTALVTWFGAGYEGDPLGAAWVYLLYAALSLFAAARGSYRSVAWAGSLLLLAGVVQEVVFHRGVAWGLLHPGITALLLYCTLLAAIAIVVQRFRLAVAGSSLAGVAWHASFGASLVAAAGLVFWMPTGIVTYEAMHWAWLAGLWLAAAIAIGWLPIWTLFQLALVATTSFATFAIVSRQPWFHDSFWPWVDPRTLQAIGLALAGLSLAWALLRLVCRRRFGQSRFSRTLSTPWLAVDRATTVGLIAMLTFFGVYAAMPGVVSELAPVHERPLMYSGDIVLPGIQNELAAGAGSWALLAALVLVLVVTLRERASRAWLALLLVVTAASVPLAAVWFEPQRAVASASVWLSVIFLLTASSKIWGRRLVVRNVEWLGWPSLAGDVLAVRGLMALAFALGLFAPLAIGAYLVVQAVDRVPGASLPGEIYGILFAGTGFLMAAAFLWSRRAETDGNVMGWPNWPESLSALLAWLPVIALAASAAFHVATALAAHPVVGPDPQSIFARAGWPTAYSTPVLMVAIALTGFAIRDRSGGWALAAALVMNVAVTIGWLLGHTADLAEPAVWVRLGQLNAVASALVTLVWLGAIRWQARREDRTLVATPSPAFSMQAAIAPAILTLGIGWAWSQLVANPVTAPLTVPVLGGVANAVGWLSLAVVTLAGIAAARAAGRTVNMLGVTALLVAIATFTAGVAAHWDTGNWLAFNTLYGGHAIIAALLLTLAWRGTAKRANAPQPGETVSPPTGALWPVVQVAIIVGLAALEFGDNLWWAVGGWLLAGAGFSPALAWVFQRRRYLYLGVPLINLAGVLAAIDLNWITDPREFFYWNVICLAVPVVGWLAVERFGIEPRRFRSWIEVSPVHRVATRLALVLMIVAVVFGLSEDAAGLSGSPPQLFLDWIALGATLVAVLACLWDAKARDAVAMLYLLGLSACGLLLHRLQLSPSWLLSTGTVVLASYVLLTSYLWSRRQGLMQWAAALRMPPRDGDELAGHAWLAPCNTLLIVAVAGLSWLIEMTEMRVEIRFLTAQATLAQVASLALLARGERRGWLQHGALAIGALGAVYFGWAWLLPGETLTWLNALVVVAAATAGVGAFYGLALGKLLADTSDWLPAARRLTPILAAASALALCATLGLEVWQYLNLGEVRIAWQAVLVVALTLAALAAAALAAGVLPGRDPLGLSERGRTAYVYAAEIILGLLFVHIRVTMPWLFTGFYQQFWPLIVMGLAYLGVGCAELFRRRGQTVLAEPLDNTGILLPVLPVIGYWAADSRVDYSLLLFCVGVLYAGLSVARRSFGFGVLAAIAANGGLWFFLNRQEGWGFLEHPQVWLIPPALCVLGAAYMNRRQLSEAQMTAVRYTTSMAIYISSTADIFLNGVAEAPMLPLVLAGLSILGIAAGILLRVRAFLFLGTGFLVLAMFTIIWHAAVDRNQTWIWWVSGIVAGLLIFVTVAIFEKKRQEVLAAFDRLKQWEA